MDIQQSIRVVRDTFENSYDKGRFIYLMKNLLNHIEEKTFSYQGNFIPSAYQPYISKLERVGTYSDSEHKIDILVVQLRKETYVERARSMQRNFIAWYLNGSRGGELKDAALATFVSPNLDDWRFSLVKMDYRFEEGKGGRMKVKEEFTPACRWSFLVGKNETSHTAQSRLAPIIADDKRNPTLKELEEAFNIEKVTREFFEKYRQLFLKAKEELDKIVEKNSKVKNDFENKNINTVDFAKKLLGQIVFLYFLQKKGWFGVARDSEWGAGSKQFLRELSEEKHWNYKNFFNDILEPLFYEALRIDRSHDDDYYSRFDCRIPFLNGGLFDPIGGYDWVHTDILLPNELFSNCDKTKEGDIGNGILDVFDRYNFTVKEDEPLEKEVAVDPEMLGKVFENLLEVKDRKSKGTYYTPREIVHYMCQQSLINYLVTELEGKVPKEDIETLIHYGEIVSENEARVVDAGKETGTYYHKLPESIRVNAKLIDEKLVNIRVCDPAIGSGAFPVGMMSEIVRTRNVLSIYTKEPNRTPYNFKRGCIQNSLYGVDIDPGAVEIAKLRLWLSLVVDEEDIKQIKPLPNLDYKIVCGNSLLSYPYKPMGLEKIEKFKNDFFSETNPNKKKDLKKDIDDAIYNLYKNTEKSLGYKINFDFQINFSEVFRNGNGGFDVVIANPPYIGQKGNKDLFEIMKSNVNFEKKMDYWYFFLHRAYEITKQNRINTFITPNYWITAQGGKKIRTRIVKDFKILEYINFNENAIFEAGIHTNVFILEKSKKTNHSVKCTIFINVYEDNFLINRGNELNFSVDQEKIFNSWTGYVHFLPDDVLKVINKLYINCEKLSDNETKGISKKGITSGKKVTDGICNINQGVLTGKDRYVDKENRYSYGVFILNKDEVTELNLNNDEKKHIKKFFKNSDIKKYYVEKNSKYYLTYVNDIENEKELKQLPRIYNHLLKYKNLLGDRSINGVLESAYKRGKWWALTTDRPNIDFSGDKILCPQRSSCNTFAYSDSEWFAASDVFYISLNKKDYSLKYILSILNSKLTYFWLYYMGKRKGNILEQTLEPLQFIPIKKISPSDQKPFIQLADQIIPIKESDDYLQSPAKQARVIDLEREIDQMVYKLYALTPKEIAIVEGRSE